MKTILVPLDGSALAEQVLPYVRLLAALYAGRVLLLRVITAAERDAVLAGSTAAPPVEDESLKTDWQWEQRALAQLSQSARDYLTTQAHALDAASITTDLDVVSGPPASTIVRVAACRPDTVITMTTHGYSGVRRWMLGSIADTVMQTTPTPIFLVRGAAAEPMGQLTVRRLMVPLNGSPLAEQALPHAIDLAVRARAELLLLRVVVPVIEAQSDFALFDSPLPLSGEQLEAERDYALQQLVALAEQLALYGVPIRPLVAAGDLTKVIVDEATRQRTDMIVMAIDGASERGPCAVCRVAEKVLHATATP